MSKASSAQVRCSHLHRLPQTSTAQTSTALVPDQQCHEHGLSTPFRHCRSAHACVQYLMASAADERHVGPMETSSCDACAPTLHAHVHRQCTHASAGITSSTNALHCTMAEQVLSRQCGTWGVGHQGELCKSVTACMRLDSHTCASTCSDCSL